MARPKLGEEIVISARLTRAYREITPNGKSEAYWATQPIERRTAVYIGYRTLNEGIIRNNWEEGHAYERTNTFDAALVVLNERQNPVLVPFSAIHRVTTEEPNNA